MFGGRFEGNTVKFYLDIIRNEATFEASHLAKKCKKKNGGLGIYFSI